MSSVVLCDCYCCCGGYKNQIVERRGACIPARFVQSWIINMVDNQWTVLTTSLNALHEENHHSMPANVMCITTTTLEAPVFLLMRLTGSTPVIWHHNKACVLHQKLYGVLQVWVSHYIIVLMMYGNNSCVPVLVCVDLREYLSKHNRNLRQPLPSTHNWLVYST